MENKMDKLDPVLGDKHIDEHGDTWFYMGKAGWRKQFETVNPDTEFFNESVDRCPAIGTRCTLDDGTQFVYTGSDWQRVVNPEKWQDTVIDELVICGIYCKEHDTDPRRAVSDIIDWHVSVALDSAVSSEARALAEREWVDLTDDEIEEIGKSYFDEWSFGFARAVIAAFKEKNK